MKFDPDWRVAPGEVMKEMLEDRGLSVTDLATALGVSEPVALALLGGTEPLTPRYAERLVGLLGVIDRFWLNLEAEYRRPVRRTALPPPPPPIEIRRPPSPDG